MPYKDPAKQAAFKLEWARKARRENPEPFRRRSREYAKRHPEQKRTQRKRHYQRHRNEILDRASEKRQSNPRPYRLYYLEYRLRKKYGMTVEQYAALLETQGFKCVICRDSLIASDRSPCIDHCHQGGHVRSVLCTRCNSAIAMLRHSARIARAAVSYLELEVLFNQQAA